MAERASDSQIAEWNDILSHQTYISGSPSPTASDFAAFASMGRSAVTKAGVHVVRFHRHMTSFSSADHHRVMLGGSIAVHPKAPPPFAATAAAAAHDPRAAKKAAKKAAKEAAVRRNLERKKQQAAATANMSTEAASVDKQKTQASKAKKAPPVVRPKLPDLTTPARRPSNPESYNGTRSTLVTSALPYVNNEPHLGNIIGCVLSADVFARWSRLRGHNTLYVCGTDEYGTATETKAMEENTTPKEVCDRYHVKHRNIYKWFHIQFDMFGRTSTSSQTEVAQGIFKRVEAQGMLVEQETEQLYCAKYDKFLADRYVIGTCPKCGYDDARGDQCDKCGGLLDPTELINAHYKYDASAPITRKSTNHLYLDLPRLATRLESWVGSAPDGHWSENTRRVTRAWLRDGLKPRCITRDLVWGTKVPRTGYEKKVFYVWFDAPIGYISITAELCKKVNNAIGTWEAWWRDPKRVSLVQFMGKDNIPFHTVIFPSSLMATGDTWTLLDKISTTEYMNYDGGKFSKSRGRGVFGSNCADTGIPADVWRYYLLSNRPESSDSDFSWKAFQLVNNSELLANLGNFCNRALIFLNRNFEGRVPTYELVGGADGRSERERKLACEVDAVLKQWDTALSKQQIRTGAQLIMSASRFGNGYLQETTPWVLLKKGDAESKAQAAVVLATCAQLIHCLAVMTFPYMPGISQYLCYQLGYEDGCGLIPTDEQAVSFAGLPAEWRWDAVPAGRKLPSPFTLFDKLSDEDIEACAAKYGSQGSSGSGQPKFSATLRVGEIITVGDHPTADKLYLLTVSLGPAHGQRRVVAGLKNAYPGGATELLGKRVVLVCNLEVAKIKGEESQGMVLVADKKGLMGLLNPAGAAHLGDLVCPKGYEHDPAPKPLTLKDFKAIGVKAVNGVVVLGAAPLLAGDANVAIIPERVGTATCPVR